jgi:hypothetical protein
MTDAALLIIVAGVMLIALAIDLGVVVVLALDMCGRIAKVGTRHVPSLDGLRQRATGPHRRAQHMASSSLHHPIRPP